MSTPIGLAQRQRLSFPCITEDFLIVPIAIAGGAGSSLAIGVVTAIRTIEASIGRNYPDNPATILLQAPTGNDLFLKSATNALAGVGYKVAAGDSIMLCLAGKPADHILYECAGSPSVICYF